MKTFYKLKFLIVIAIITIIVISKLSAQSESVTVPPSDTITPFELIDYQINFPLLQAIPFGDVNGDGNIDMVFHGSSGNFETEDLEDMINKSVIITEAGNNENAIIFNDKIIKGIGDVNNDGFDDGLEVNLKQIYFGNIEGLIESEIALSFPDSYKDIIFKGDINSDGLSEYIITNEYSDTSIYIYSGTDTIPFILGVNDIPYYIGFGLEQTNYAAYDNDNDGQSELCIATAGTFNNMTRIFMFLSLDFENHEVILESTQAFDVIHEVTHFYPHALADINGDGLLDACHFFFKDTINYDSYGYDMEVFFGKNESPYFETSALISLGHPLNRTAYFCGDVTGDGCEDVCGNYNNDSIAIYKGSTNVAEIGFSHYYVSNANMNNEKTMKLKTKNLYFQGYDLFNMDYGKLDYNLDGINDLFFNYWHFDENQRIDTIGTSIVLGENLNTSNAIVIGSPIDEAYTDIYFGDKMKNIGDFNNDGHDDWAVLAVDGCYLNVYFGSPELDKDVDIRFLLPQKNLSKCFDWSFGDVNGDGVNDFIISNSSNWSSVYNTYMDMLSNVFIFYGNPNMTGNYYYSDADIVLHDNGSITEYGHSVGVVGDYNADGFDDIVVGGTGTYNNNRIALMYFGSNEGIGPEPDLYLPMPCSGCYNPFPDPITTCGDINADGYDDFTLGDDNCGSGRSLVYFGGPEATNQPATIINSPIPGRKFGYYTTKQSGDFNWDGYPDLVNYSYYNRTLYFYYGGPDFDSIPDHTILDTTLSVGLSAIDYTPVSPNSNSSNLLVANYNSEGSSFKIYSGGEDSDNEVIYKLQNDLVYTVQGVASGDFNNDGYLEIYAGIPGERNYGYLYGGIIFLYEPYLVGIDEESTDNQKQLKVYPNPARNNLSVEISNSNDSPLILNIYDISGKLLKSQEIKNVTSKDVISIPINKLGEGIYVLKIQQSGETYYSKFVVNK